MAASHQVTARLYRHSVSLTVQIGLVFALATAFAAIVGNLLKYRGARTSPQVDWRRPVRTSLSLFGARDYTLGIVVASASWVFHVTALSLAPISLVQSVIAGGLVMLTVCADRLFGHDVTRREWIGVALTAAGLTFLAATMSGVGGDAHSDYSASALVAFVAVVAVAGLASTVYGWAPDGRRGSVVAAGAGLLWGASDVSIKALSGSLGSDGPAVLLHPLAPTIAVLSLIGLTVSARSLQQGAAVAVITATAAAANVVSIAAGPLVFSEPMPGDAVPLTLRILAFGLVVTAAALTPPPLAPAPARR